MRTRGVERWAALLVGIEGLALMVLVGWQVVAIITGDTAAIETAWALVALTAVGAAAVLAFAIAIARGNSWGRSGGVLTQLLTLAVALGAATGAYAHPLTGLAIAVPALVVLVVLVFASRSAGRRAAASADAPE